MRSWTSLLVALLFPITSMGQVMWENHVIDTGLEGAFEICIADVNGDGNKDVVAVGYNQGNNLLWYDNVEGTGSVWTTNYVDINLLRMLDNYIRIAFL